MFFFLIGESAHQSYRQILLHIHKSHVACFRIEDDRRIMSCVAQHKSTRYQIQSANQHGDEHIRVVVLRPRVVEGIHYFARRYLLCGEVSEQTSWYRREQWCRSTRARHSANSEVGQLVGDKEVVEVAAHL